MQKIHLEPMSKMNSTKVKDLFLSESADLLFHYLILLQAKGFQLNDVVEVLKTREK